MGCSSSRCLANETFHLRDRGQKPAEALSTHSLRRQMKIAASANDSVRQLGQERLHFVRALVKTSIVTERLRFASSFRKLG